MERTSENMAALLACSQGATMLVNSSSAPYCSAYPLRLPGTPLGEREDAPAAAQPHVKASRLAMAHKLFYITSRVWQCSLCMGGSMARAAAVQVDYFVLAPRII